MRAHRSYVVFLLCSLAAILLTVIGLNLLLTENATPARTVLAASQWQQRTGGITVANTGRANNRLFKTLRLNDRLPEINAMVFGSSTSMAIRYGMFPDEIRIYNFTQNGNWLSSTIGEIDYVLEHHPHVKWMLVEIAWANGSVYGTADPFPADLSVEHAITEVEQGRLRVAEIRDALSYPRVRNLLRSLGSIAVSRDAWASFRKTFLESGGGEYPCPDGLAKDYQQSYPGLCAGFAYDGSNAFRHLARVDDARRAIVAAAVPDSSVGRRIMAARGEPNRSLLDRVAAQAERLEQRGGRMIFMIPPALPGFELALAQHRELAPFFRRTRQVLQDWARQRRLFLFDAGASERFGCVASEFVDAEHALPECYRKVLHALWEAERALAPSR
jgi:hypothetical protein